MISSIYFDKNWHVREVNASFLCSMFKHRSQLHQVGQIHLQRIYIHSSILLRQKTTDIQYSEGKEI